MHAPTTYRVPAGRDLLARELLADGILCAVMGTVLVIGSGTLAGWFGLSSALVRAAGLILLPWAAFVAFVGARAPIPPAGAWTVVLVNFAWCAASVVLVLADAADPTGLGAAVVLAQGAGAAAIGALQWSALRRGG